MMTLMTYAKEKIVMKNGKEDYFSKKSPNTSVNNNQQQLPKKLVTKL